MTGVDRLKIRYGSSFLPLAVVAFAVLFLPTFAFKYTWIALRSVEVMEDLRVKVDRRIQRDFWGNFTVSLRRSSDSKQVCVGSPDRSIPYRKSANVGNPQFFDFDHWMSLDHAWELNSCFRRGFEAGEDFYLITCHEALGVFDLMLARRCVKSNVFTPTRESLQKLIN